jgi:Flp pilus assembly pilin Flp
VYVKLNRFWRDQLGANAIEYAVVLAFVAVAMIASMRSLNMSLGKIIGAWGPEPITKIKPKPIGNVNNAFGFQNLTPVEVKTLYKNTEQIDKMDGISIEEWSVIYQNVTGNKPTKTSVNNTFNMTDGAVSSGGNNDGILTYMEFKNAILNESY